MVVLLVTTAIHAGSARFSRISVEDGLSQSSVESIAEDRYGFLWFGTQEGLNRFDGYEFTVHQASPRPGRLRDGFIRAITPDRRGDLWIGTESGLQHLDVASGRFGESVTPPGIGVRLNTLRVAPDGRLWFAGPGGGLWSRPARHGAQAELVAGDAFGAAVSVSAIAFGGSRSLWVAAHGHLYSLDIEERDGTLLVRPTHTLRDVGLIRVIHVDAEGVVWLGRQDAAPLSFDPRNGEVTDHPELPRFVLTIVGAGEGRLWIGGRDAGLTRFDPKTREIITYRHEPGNEDSLAENDVAVVHHDRGGSLWVGAWNGGVSRMNLYAQAFRTLRSNPGERDSLPDDDVTQMAEGPDGRLWAMTRNDVLTVGDPATGSFSAVPFDRDLTAIAFAGSQLFAGTATGLVELDPRSGRLVAPSEAVRAAGLDRVRIGILEGGDDHLWIVASGALYRLPAKGSSATLRRVALSFDGEPTSLVAASPERLWISYAEGALLRVNVSPNGELAVTRVGDAALSARGRLSAVVEQKGVLWIGTARGIGRLTSDGRVRWLDLESGMPTSRSVASILSDDAGVLWIPTNQGITRFDPSTGRAVHFGAVQGAQASGYVEGGAARGRSGLFYFAGRGITVFDPRQVQDNPYRPRVLFTALEILHRPVVPSWMDPDSPLTTGIHAAKDVALGPDAAVFSVEMAAPGVSDPRGVRFVHRLDGFDHDWIETTADRRVATYTRLAPGRYVLRARARTHSGLWSTDEATLRIQVLPPWWRTPAALAMWCAVVILAVSAVVRETRRRTGVRIALAEGEALRRTSVTDPLTGLYNRRFLAAWLEHEVPRALRTHELLLFVMADLDNLKEINDAFGHDAGDRAIRAVADLLLSHARAGDPAVRWGGDEFVLVLRSIGRAQSTRIVERLRASAETLDLGLEESTRCTISVGFASFPFLEHDPDALTGEQTLQLADRALLHSKRRGRNAWTGLVATPMATAAAVHMLLDAATDRSPSPAIRIIEGPAGREERHAVRDDRTRSRSDSD